MSLEAKIRDTSERNVELLNILHQTDSSVPDLEAQKRHVADLEKQVAQAAERLKQIGYRRKQELREHEKYRDSVLRRFAFKVGGKAEKFEARAAKEEREYFDVLQEEHQADVMKKNLDEMLADARTLHGELEIRAATHVQAQNDLDRLYESIFTGPSPGFPEEDERERETSNALQIYKEARSRAEAEGKVVSILTQAQTRLNGALMSMEDALHASRRDMYGGGTFSDMMERNALNKAENLVRQAKMLVTQAQAASPMVRPLPQVKIAQGNLLGDVFFDNIFSDMAFHEKIQQSNLEVRHCSQSLNIDLMSATQRHMELLHETDQKNEVVRQARLRLQRAREAAFQRITGRVASSSPPADVPPPEGPPPSYTERADPAENWWEN
ncbi:hypothetical protein J7T55_010057 [Diaporthe amygdali]|uniref:uncharacterized protein n=1 Tax=Phomopsis amygdali TaxID=1214568 RepID=UPI0022FEFD32|nr:uncharacterized protein J7T55_010057 [Diaporthe amygdali]KAJ0113813.1 hypothetical protein J7T55_010057 [Diaporthe amygdali]